MSTIDSPFVRWFGDVALADRAMVGGKGASLGELTRASVPTPPGFIVTTHAFEHFLAAIDETGTIRASVARADGGDLGALGRMSEDVRRLIEDARMPADLESALAAACGRLCGDDERLPLAVRSSATGEDSTEASYAGLQDTHLWVRGRQAIERSLRACWASLYGVEAVSYRLHHKLEVEHVAMAVVIQRMVQSRASGVMFTRSPTTGDRSVVAIEGSWGLGSCVVSGEVTPDKFVVSKVTGEIIQRVVSDKSVRHVPDAEAGGVRSEQVPEPERGIPCLSDAEIGELVETGKRMERHYGFPLDIEWAIADEDGAGPRLYLLQSRPETAWTSRERKPVAAPRAKPFDHVFAALGGRKG